MEFTIRVELHFGLHPAHAEAADIEIEIKSKPKWPQMKAKWAALTSPIVVVYAISCIGLVIEGN
jgi:hypothetical protein